MLGAVYIPSASNPSIYLDHSLSVDEILLQFPHDKILLVGDYNTYHILWSLESSNVTTPALSVLASNTDKLVLEHIVETCHLHNLQQFNLYPNSHGSFLDLVLSNIDGILVELSSDELLPADYYHPCLLVHCKLQYMQSPMSRHPPRYDFERVDFERILCHLNSVD